MGIARAEAGNGSPAALLVSQEGQEEVEAPVPLEEPLAVEVNGRVAAVLMRTPGDEKELALGYCLSEGLIQAPEEVLLLHHCGSGAEEELSLVPPEPEGPFGVGNRVRLRVTRAAEERLQGQAPRWVFSGCSGVDAAALGAELVVGERELRIAPEVLWTLVPEVVQAQEAYRATGGIHAAALADRAGQLLALKEDVGRHNAVDKVIGQAALAGSLPAAAVLVATGRASSDIVAKAARVGIPVVASFSSSTSLAVRLAEAAGVTLIGYLRRVRFTVYTHRERIALTLTGVERGL